MLSNVVEMAPVLGWYVHTPPKAIYFSFSPPPSPPPSKLVGRTFILAMKAVEW